MRSTIGHGCCRGSARYGVISPLWWVRLPLAVSPLPCVGCVGVGGGWLGCVPCLCSVLPLWAVAPYAYIAHFPINTANFPKKIEKNSPPFLAGVGVGFCAYRVKLCKYAMCAACCSGVHACHIAHVVLRVSTLAAIAAALRLAFAADWRLWRRLWRL